MTLAANMAVAVGLALVTAPSVVSAEQLAVRVAGATPFSRAELEDALRVRLAPRHRVVVASGHAGITVTVDGRSRSVVLGDERGVAAARVVALVAAALAVEGGAPAEVAAGIDDAGPAGLPAAGPAAVPRGRIQVGITVDVPVGEHAPVGAIGAFYTNEGAGKVRWQIGMGFDHHHSDPGRTDQVAMFSLVMRPGLVLALDERARIAVGVTGLAAPFYVHGGRNDLGVLAGGGVTLRLAMGEFRRTQFALQLGVEVIANRMQYVRDGAIELDTGRVRPWVLIGVSQEHKR